MVLLYLQFVMASARFNKCNSFSPTPLRVGCHGFEIAKFSGAAGITLAHVIYVLSYEVSEMSGMQFSYGEGTFSHQS